jgi:hypothetical protein
MVPKVQRSSSVPIVELDTPLEVYCPEMAVSGAALRAEREALDVLAADIADVWGVDAAILTRLEQRTAVEPARARRYRQTLNLLTRQRRLVRRQLIEELRSR